MPGNVPLPSEISNPIILADWLELLALTSADGNSSHGDLQRVLNRLGTENIDSLCTESMRELNRRIDSTGDNYPFTFSGTLLSTKGDWRQYTPYIFCLLLSYCDDVKKKVAGIRHETMFEKLSCIAAKQYIGGDAIRFGSPRDTLPKGFIDALIHVCGQVGEWSCSNVGRRTLRSKDGGLDIVAWKHFPDRQIGKLILFGHCASGANWDNKINELQPNDFCSLWLGGDRSPIVKSFFIPHRLSPELFENRAVSAKLFFDRCRIACWVSNDEFRGVVGDTVVQWCEQLLEKVKS
jgi:hypothetical protein